MAAVADVTAAPGAGARAGGEETLARFFGFEPRLRVVERRRPVPGAVELVAAPPVARRLEARGLPARFLARPGRMCDEVPPGEPILLVRDDWPERPIAVARAGEVVVGFAPDEAVRATLEERGREAPRPVTASFPFDYRLVPPRLRLGCARLLHRIGRLGVRGAARSHRESADALRFALLAGLERAARAAGDVPPGPRPFWPEGKRFAVALTHDVDSTEGLARIAFLRRPEVARGLRSTWFVVGEVARRDPTALERLAFEGCEIAAHDETHDNRLAFLPPAAMRARLDTAAATLAAIGLPAGFRSPSLGRSPPLFEEIARRFAYDSSVPDDDGAGGGSGTVFPFMRGGLLEVPITMPLDADCAFRGLAARETLDLWLAALDRARRAGGVALVVTHPEPHFTGGSAELQEAYEGLLDAVAQDREAFVGTVRAIARHWTDGRRA